MAKRYDVACAGLQVVDVLVEGVDAGLFQRESTRARSVSLALGGDALNQALALAQLGSAVALLGAAGDDQLGDVLLALLKGYSLDVFDARVPTRTSVSVVLIDGQGERRFVRQPGNNDALGFEHIRRDVVEDARILSVAGVMALSSLDGEGMERLLRLAREADSLTVLDFRINRPRYDMDQVRRTIALADWVLPNQQEAAYLTGETRPQAMAQALQAMGAKNVALKLGEQGCLLAWGAERAMIPGCPARVVDGTGAGDNFAGAFLHALSRGLHPVDCARFACAAGAMAVERVGANGGLGGHEQVWARMKATYGLA